MKRRGILVIRNILVILNFSHLGYSKLKALNSYLKYSQK